MPRFITYILSFLKEIYQKKFLIIELTKRDFKQQFMGSFLGLVWAFLQPIAFLGILWVIFTFGFKSGKLGDGTPFLAFLFTGLVAWDLFSRVWLGSTGMIFEYSFLVKKINFRLSILPVVKIFSNLIMHIIFISIVIVVLIVNKIYPSIYWLQVVYYIICSSMLVLGLSWISSALNVFIKDVGQLIQIIVQFGFWLTPIIWDPASFPKKYSIFIKMNPAWYLVDGYRRSFIYKTPFWKGNVNETIYFWGVTLIFLLLGMIVFKKLRPHFADVI